MLSLGACVVNGKTDGFYVEIKPLNDNAVPDALKVSGFDLAKLAQSGERPEYALTKLRDWVKKASGSAKPVFVGFNAGFDWSFVNWYFIHFLGENPFGIAPLDVKAYYMGLVGCSWEDTKSSRIRPDFQPSKPGNHNALADARAQAEMFEKMRATERP
jgi:DNA polymerase III epsilon subunit-like protein